MVKLDARLESSDPALTEFFVANSTLETVDVVLLTGGTGKTTEEVVADDLSANATSGYFAVVPGVHRIAVRTADGTTDLAAFEMDWTDSAGDAIAIVIDGEVGSMTAEAMSGDGTFSDPKVVTASEKEAEVPDRFRIVDNYPNPFNPSTTIRYEVANRAPLTIVVYDVAGHKVRTLVDEEVIAGHHDVVWDGRNDGGTPVASGTYLIRLQTASHVDSRSITLVK